MGSRLVGDWSLAGRLLAAAPLRLKKAVARAVREEAQLLRKQIVEGITKQAPGGQAFRALAAATLAARRLQGFKGSKALLRRADLRNSITVVVEDNTAFVGILRTARKGDRRAVNIAEVQEFGAGPFVVRMTPKMRRFLFAMLKERGETGGTSGGGQGRNVVVIRIPPRPFFRPVFEVFRRGARGRFLRRVGDFAIFGRAR